MSTTRRVQLEPAWLLHQRDFRDSSRIIECYTRDHGRIALFARGVRSAKSRYAALLQPFVPLLVSWSGSGDGGAFTGAEASGAPLGIAPRCLMSGFYANELLMKLLVREDPHPDIYEHYGQLLHSLADPATEARGLRLFEKRLLDSLGFGTDYRQLSTTGEAVDAARYYHVHAGRGVTAPALGPDAADSYSGADLLSLAAEELMTPSALNAARRLLRAAIGEALDGQPLETRRVARAVRDGSQGAGRSSE
jgi:DNA repair protein RecO (recombination protein O)